MDQNTEQKYTSPERTWTDVMEFFKQRYGDIDLEGILFLIGVQELGRGYQKFNKAQKMDVMHVAICTLLEPYGFYTYEGNDADGWPHWKATEKLPNLKAGQQTILMKTSIIDYFKTHELI
jgi:hypothetical protein